MQGSGDKKSEYWRLFKQKKLCMYKKGDQMQGEGREKII